MTNTLLTPKYISSLNLLRGLAAVFVCFFHTLPGSFNEFPFLKCIFSSGYLGLDLFFVISGFIIPYSMYQNKYSIKSFPRFLLKRSLRIEPPYIISFILIVAMRYIHIYINNHSMYTNNWTQFGLHFLYLNQYFGYDSYNVVYWTLAIEFQFYILMGFLFPLIINQRKIIPLFLFVLFSAMCWFLNLHYNWFVFQYGYLFISGILIFLYVIKRISLAYFISLFVVILSLMYFKNGLDVLLTSIFACLAIILIKKEWKLTNFLGTISFSLYLTHTEASGWFILYLKNTIHNDICLRVAALLFALLFAIGFYYLFEKPALQLSKRIKYKRPD